MILKVKEKDFVNIKSFSLTFKSNLRSFIFSFNYTSMQAYCNKENTGCRQKGSGGGIMLSI